MIEAMIIMTLTVALFWMPGMGESSAGSQRTSVATPRNAPPKREPYHLPPNATVNIAASIDEIAEKFSPKKTPPCPLYGAVGQHQGCTILERENCYLESGDREHPLVEKPTQCAVYQITKQAVERRAMIGKK